MLIRKYKSSDRLEVEKIHFETGFLGKSMDVFLSHHKFWSNGIKYYLEEEPDSIFVADDAGKVAGYVLGCLDDKKHSEFFAAIFNTTQNLVSLPLMPKKDRKFWLSQMRVIANNITGKSEEVKFKTPQDSGHVHINMRSQYRRLGIGSKLLSAFEDYAKDSGVHTIHADSFKTRLNPSVSFWEKNGFKETSRVRTSFWSDKYPNEAIYLVCYVKQL
jgi:ribosomal protein S18 acetylase RimI-like enzyme